MEDFPLSRIFHLFTRVNKIPLNYENKPLHVQAPPTISPPNPVAILF